MSPHPPVDRVAVLGVTAHGTHGVLPDERRDGQRFVADLVLHLPTHRAADRDDLTETVNYAEVAARARDVLAGEACDLLETVASRVAAAALADRRVAAVDVTLHKPEAPVGVPFGDVTVTVHRTRDDLAVDQGPSEPVDAVLALGANLGRPEDTLAAALGELAATDGVELGVVSPVVETAPVGPASQPRYLNAVALVRTTLSARRLLHVCQDVERSHGRRREVHWGPRTLDLDILTYGGLVARTWDLTLPHERAGERGFVLWPWLAVDPGAVLPTLDGPVPVAPLLASLALPDGAVVERPDLDLARRAQAWASPE